LHSNYVVTCAYVDYLINYHAHLNLNLAHV